MTKNFNLTLDISKPVNPQNSFEIWRGDSVVFSFLLTNNGEAVEFNAGELRVFAKQIQKNGEVDKDSEPLFSGTFNNIGNVAFDSQQTAGDAGNYLLTVIVYDSESQLITAQCIYFEIKENGYAGYYQPSEDFRDEILGYRNDAVQAASNAQNQATIATTQASNASASATTAQNQATIATQQATNASDSATSASESAEQAKDSSDNAKADVEEAIAEAQTIANNAVEQAQASAQSASQSESNAEYWAGQAQAISDPENRIGTLEGQVSTLQTGKVNKGVLYFNSGVVKSNEQITPQIPFSICCYARLYNFDKMETNPYDNAGGFTFFKNAKYKNGVAGVVFGLAKRSDTQYRYVLSAATDGTSSVLWKNSPFFIPDTNWHRYVAVFKSLTECSLYVDGEEISLTHYRNTLSTATLLQNYWRIGTALGNDVEASKASAQISDVAVFNFDITAEDAPYSINDYQNGKSIPPYLLDGNAYFLDSTKANEATVSGFTSRNTVEFVEGSGLESTITETGFNGAQDWTIAFIDLPIFIKSGDIIDIELGQHQTVIDGTASNVSRFGAVLNFYKQNASGTLDNFVISPTSNTSYRSVYTPSESTNRIGIQYSFEQSATSQKDIFPFKMKVNGAEVALDNFTFGGEVLDYSGNGRHGKIEGSVKGDNDTKVETLFEKFSTRISEQTNG